ncbi:hypothetical protein NY2A_b020R [Paramecium bursaria Chlorella virus NY2A]|uniref:Uncharacterized protein b020R n=1 Tax=Paramecium bursaria Chlorella virus NY2A TaxID=46021 RepID=A7IVP5_PBCVN|nr:hypothetical protein NY2A_b020R [Paramecium bursaria Chlorella virus NY2A]ABT14419.1 hypothetical protein NY2A_b020R [Paramecium bursaria Chlorella virus NY2A]
MMERRIAIVVDSIRIRSHIKQFLSDRFTTISSSKMKRIFTTLIRYVGVCTALEQINDEFYSTMNDCQM